MLLHLLSQSLMTSVATSNDIHIGKLLAIEDEMRSRFMDSYTQTISGVKAGQKTHNRARVDEIMQLVKSNRSAIDRRAEQLRADQEQYE